MSSLKHSAVNDILKNYYMLATFFSYSASTEPLKNIMFAKVGGKDSDIIVAPRGTTCIL